MNFKKFGENIEKIKKSGILEDKDKILLGFSGGPDSMFMYHILNYLKNEYNLELSLLYVNHNLREDVNKDLEIVKEFALKENVNLYIENINVLDYSKKNKKSIELSARELRYKSYNKVLMEIGYNKIATGHNLDDNVETFFFRLIRGTSLKGLEGIPEKRGEIIRPILHFKKEDIIKFLDENGIKYVIDYTNLENDYTRNYIRNIIFPEIENINVKFKDKIISLIQEIKNGNDDNKEYLKKILMENNVEISREKLNKIYSSLYDKQGKLITVGNKKFDLGNNKILLREYDEIKIVLKGSEVNKLEEISLEKDSLLNWGEYEIGFFSNGKEMKKYKGYDCYKILFDIDKVSVRKRKAGDRIFLKNLGYKKLKKIFIDEKIPSTIRENTPIFVDKNNGEILLVGNLKTRENVIKVNIKNICIGDKILIIGRKNEKR